MTTTVEEVLGAIRKNARSTSDLGTSFERLMVEWPAGTGEPRLRLEDRKEPRPHQRAAIEAVLDGFGTHDRGAHD